MSIKPPVAYADKSGGVGLLWLLSLALLLTLGSTAAAPSGSDPVDAYLEEVLETEDIPGLAVALLQNGRIVKVKGYGFADLEHAVPVHPWTLFQSGSVGKQFTAAAVLMLAERGVLSVDDHVSNHLEGTPAAWKDITIRHLLTHTSGIPEYVSEEFDARRDYTESELLGIAFALPLAFKPGTAWSYSNTGYVLLGMVIGRVSGRFYGDVIDDLIFKPLGMVTARIISEADVIPNRASGYRVVNGTWKNQEWVSPTLNTTADGSLYLSVLDLAKWDQALASGTLPSEASRRAMWTPVRLTDGTLRGYGFGWSIGGRTEHPVVEHGGHWQGFSAQITRYLKHGLTVILLANREGANLRMVAHHVAALVEPDVVPRRAAIRLDPADLQAFVGTYEVSPGEMIQIRKEGERLVARGSGHEKLSDLVPLSDTDFFAPEADLDLAFSRDAEGRVTSVTLLPYTPARRVR